MQECNPEIAVFMAKGHPHPYWATREALAWATQPLGRVDGQGPLLEVVPRAIQARGTDGSRGQADDADEGLVCWFQDTGRELMVGLADFRYVLCVDPDRPPGVKWQAWLGDRLGWQPSARCPLPTWLLRALGSMHRDMESRMEREAFWGATEQGRLGLAAHGPANMVLLESPCGEWGLCERSRVNDPWLEWGNDERGDAFNRASGCFIKCMQWLIRRFMRARRRHPNLGRLLHWPALRFYAPDLLVSFGGSNGALVACVVEAAVRAAHPSHDGDSPYEPLEAPGLSATERGDPRILVDRWCRTATGVAMPSMAAARWWLALDERSRRNMLLRIPCHYEIGMVCDMLAPLGTVKISSLRARAIAVIPSRWIMAGWMQQAGEAKTHRLCRQAMNDSHIRTTAKLAVEQMEATPEAVRQVSRLLHNICRAPTKELIAMAGRWGDTPPPIQWLFLSDPGLVLGSLGKGWSFRALAQANARWCLDEDEKVSQALIASDSDWDAGIARHVREGMDVLPLSNTQMLESAGRRYQNCLRQQEHRVVLAARCLEGLARVFLVRGNKRHALVQLGRNTDGEWVVDQCLGPSNAAVGTGMLAIAQDLAASCPLPKNEAGVEDAGEMENEGLGPLDSEHAIAARLERWLAKRKQMAQVTTLDLTKHEIGPEEVASPTGFLPALVSKVAMSASGAIPAGITIVQRQDFRGLMGAAVEISGPEDQMALLIDRMKRQWQDLEKQCEPGPPDLKHWVRGL